MSSKNCVGFMTPEAFREGNTMFGPMFVKVGTQGDLEMGSYDVQDLVPQGASVPNGKTTGGAISLQKLTATGGVDGEPLFWRDGEFGERTKVKYHGWYTSLGVTPATMTINAGEAVWFKMPDGASCTFTIAGEVPNGDIYFGLRQGNTAVCNPQPVTLDIQKILPYGTTVPEGKTTGAAISLQKLSATGGVEGEPLFWRDGEFGERTKTKYHGWYTSLGTAPAELEIKPGEGAWVKLPTDDDVCLLFPSPLNKAE